MYQYVRLYAKCSLQLQHLNKVQAVLRFIIKFSNTKLHKVAEFLHADGLSAFNGRCLGMRTLFMTLTSFVLRKGGMKESEEFGKNFPFSLSFLRYFFQRFSINMISAVQCKHFCGMFIYRP